MSPALFAICTSGLIKWVKEYISAEALSFVCDLGCGVTGSKVNQVIAILKRRATKSIE